MTFAEKSDEKLSLSFSVTDFSIPDPWLGDLDQFMNSRKMPNLGAEIHGRIQKQRKRENSDYDSEVGINGIFENELLKIKVSGKTDGVILSPHPSIEEIKSSYQSERLVERLASPLDHPYKRQLFTYGYLFWKKFGEKPLMNLCVVNTRTLEEENLEFLLDIKEYESWLKRRFQSIYRNHKFHMEARFKRENYGSLNFPFPKIRSGQEIIIKSLNEDLTKKRNKALIQAPTGSGKTLAVLKPLLEQAMDKGQKLTVVTSKNSQNKGAVRNIELLNSKKELKVLELQSKPKICFQKEVVCDPRVCEFAIGHFTKMHESDLIANFRNQSDFSTDHIKSVSKEKAVCPYQVQTNLIEYADVIVGDYNYVFSSNDVVDLISKNAEGKKKGKPVLAIDEGHELAERVRQYFCSRLSMADFIDSKHYLTNVSSDFQEPARELVNLAEDVFMKLNRSKTSNFMTEEVLTPNSFSVLVEAYNQILFNYIRSEVVIPEDDPVLELFFKIHHFLNILGLKREEIDISFMGNDSGVDSIKLTCTDASWWTQRVMKKFSKVAIFSATLKPLKFNRELLGLSEEESVSLEVESDFDPSNRPIFIVDEVSTTYRHRTSNLPVILESISQTVKANPGRYALFFQNYELLNSASRSSELKSFAKLVQRPGMRGLEVEMIVHGLGKRPTPFLLMGVQGGVFSEGVDYPRGSLDGVFIIVPALPGLSSEREILRKYFDSTYGDGFNYTYNYPGFSKSIQAAGRLIRAPEDKGVIVLYGRRFADPRNQSIFPRDWSDSLVKIQNIHELPTAIQGIREFWKKSGVEGEKYRVTNNL